MHAPAADTSLRTGGPPAVRPITRYPLVKQVQSERIWPHSPVIAGHDGHAFLIQLDCVPFGEACQEPTSAGLRPVRARLQQNEPCQPGNDKPATHRWQMPCEHNEDGTEQQRQHRCDVAARATEEDDHHEPAYTTNDDGRDRLTRRGVATLEAQARTDPSGRSARPQAREIAGRHQTRTRPPGCGHPPDWRASDGTYRGGLLAPASEGPDDRPARERLLPASTLHQDAGAASLRPR